MGIARFLRRNPSETPIELPNGPPTDLVEEVENFLGGKMADRFARAGQPIPSWTMLNRPAHGTIDELAFLLVAGNGWRLHPAVRVWAEAERCLAERLVVLGRTDYGLRRIQEDVLLPLEEELAEWSRHRTLTTGQVLSAAADALDAYCR